MPKVKGLANGIHSGGSREESVSLTFPAPEGYLHSLACGPFHHLQGQPVTSSAPASVMATSIGISPPLTLIRTLVITVGQSHPDDPG